MKVRNVVLIIVAIAVASGCSASAPARTSETAVSWNRKPLVDGAGDLRFAVVSDNAGGLRPGVFQDAVTKLNLLRPSLVMCVGDLIEGYADNEADLQKMWDEFAQEISGLNAPFFGTVGNHDVSDAMMSAYVEKRFGPLYYSFVYKDVLFISLNSLEYRDPSTQFQAGFSNAQVEFARKTLADHPNVRWTFVFTHLPLFVRTEKDYANAPGWDAVEKMLASRPHTVFVGHWHEYARHEVNGHVYYRLGTTGGDSKLRGAERGELDQIVWVTITKDGPVVANLDLNGIYADDVSTDQTTLAYGSIEMGSVVRPISIVTEERPFASGKIKVELKNETVFPLSVRASFPKDNVLVFDPSQIEASVRPSSTDSVEVSVTAPKPVDPASLQPLPLEWQARYDAPGRKPIEGKGRSAVLVEGIHACPEAAAQMTVDGDLSEWGSLPERLTMPMQFTQNEALWEGPADGSVAFGTAYDDKYLYLGFAVTDDRVVVDDQHNARQEDALTILVDARPAGAWAAPSKELDKLRGFFVISPGVSAGKEKFGEPLPEGAKAASVVTPTGYSTEIAIPTALLDKAAGGTWKQFRLNVRFHDLDSQTYDATLMWWRPAWDGPQNYAGSGTFKRE